MWMQIASFKNPKTQNVVSAKTFYCLEAISNNPLLLRVRSNDTLDTWQWCWNRSKSVFQELTHNAGPSWPHHMLAAMRSRHSTGLTLKKMLMFDKIKLGAVTYNAAVLKKIFFRSIYWWGRTTRRRGFCRLLFGARRDNDGCIAPWA